MALSMTRELRYPDLCLEHAEQTLEDLQLPSTAPVLSMEGAVMAMELVVERCAGIDVHQAQLRVCVRVPGAKGKRVEEFATFGTTTVAGLLTLRDWLAAFGVQQVVMEATGVYWKPVWAILEDEFECLLVNARHVKTGGVGLALRLLSDVVLEQSSLVGFDLDS